MKHVDPPIRYKLIEVQIPISKSIQKWLAGLVYLKWIWSRTKSEFKVIKPHERGYNTAPYELVIIGKRSFPLEDLPFQNDEYTTPEK